MDYNRAGCALLEIVSSPDMRSGEEAATYVRKVQRILRHIGVSTANMEEGSLRCDVNVSVRERRDGGRVGCADPCQTPSANLARQLATAAAARSLTRAPPHAARAARVEIKNLNSTRSIARAIDFESRRHAALLSADESVRRQTLGAPPTLWLSVSC